MQNLHIPASNETPEIDFNFAAHKIVIRGESYPENAMAFYAPVRATLQRFLDRVPGSATVHVEIALRYVNSSSTKLIRAMIAMLNSKAAKGQNVHLAWHHDADDDMMLEFGQDLYEECGSIEFCAIAEVESCTV